MTKYERVKALEYYLDDELQETAPLDSEGNVSLDFESVVPGESKTKTIWIQNKTSRLMTIESYSTDSDLHIKGPEQLRAGETGKVDITFSPPHGRLIPLEGTWGFKGIIHPNK